VAKIRGGNLVFLTWVGDHSPRHVHVYRNGKWDLESSQPMRGHASATLQGLIAQLVKEGLL
jgi:hypothetical protein